MASVFDNSAVLITGGTGSFGKKMIRTLLKTNLTRLVVYSRDELKQEEMRTNEGFTDPRLRFFLGDVRDEDRLYRGLAGIDICIHAAALKQVPALEYNPIEAVKTNINGAESVINASIDRGVKRVMAISTDKAVNPINLYGATKLVMEKLFTQGNVYADPKSTRFSCTRYGNVIGSRGSVIPLFLKQRDSGTITVTEEKMTRFWLTLQQGVDFVARCMEQMAGGEVFVPKIPSMSIREVATAMAPGCTLKSIGIRPGEKMHEVLVSRAESLNAYEFDDMFVLEPTIMFRRPPEWTWDKRGKKMEPGSKYSSDANKAWLTPDDLRRLVEQG